jgi:hypothetical protein
VFDERYDEQYVREQFAYCRKHNLHIEDRMFIVSMIDDTLAINVRPKKTVFPRSLETLKRTGVNITSFRSSVDNEGV